MHAVSRATISTPRRTQGMSSKCSILLLVACVAGVTAPLRAQAISSARAGPRAVLERSQEIALARSAAPASISARAQILVFDGADYVVAESGSNGVTCVVNRSWQASIEPHCYDREAAETMLPMELRRNVLRHRGASEESIEREIATGVASGKYHLPRRPAMTYMMSAAQVLYDDEGRRVGPWRPHLMIYYPYLKEDDVGFAGAPDMRVGMVGDAGTPFSTLIIVMANSIPLAPKQ